MSDELKPLVEGAIQNFADVRAVDCGILQWLQRTTRRRQEMCINKFPNEGKILSWTELKRRQKEKIAMIEVNIETAAQNAEQILADLQTKRQALIDKEF